MDNFIARTLRKMLQEELHIFDRQAIEHCLKMLEANSGKPPKAIRAVCGTFILVDAIHTFTHLSSGTHGSVVEVSVAMPDHQTFTIDDPAQIKALGRALDITMPGPEPEPEPEASAEEPRRNTAMLGDGLKTLTKERMHEIEGMIDPALVHNDLQATRDLAQAAVEMRADIMARTRVSRAIVETQNVLIEAIQSHLENGDIAEAATILETMKAPELWK